MSEIEREVLREINLKQQAQNLFVNVDAVMLAKAVKAKLRKMRRRDMDLAAESLGLVKVRGAVSGRVYYE